MSAIMKRFDSTSIQEDGVTLASVCQGREFCVSAKVAMVEELRW